MGELRARCVRRGCYRREMRARAILRAVFEAAKSDFGIGIREFDAVRTRIAKVYSRFMSKNPETTI
jgi:hypothetical protein